MLPFLFFLFIAFISLELGLSLIGTYFFVYALSRMKSLLTHWKYVNCVGIWWQKETKSTSKCSNDLKWSKTLFYSGGIDFGWCLNWVSMLLCFQRVTNGKPFDLVKLVFLNRFVLLGDFWVYWYKELCVMAPECYWLLQISSPKYVEVHHFIRRLSFLVVRFCRDLSYRVTSLVISLVGKACFKVSLDGL